MKRSISESEKELKARKQNPAEMLYVVQNGTRQPEVSDKSIRGRVNRVTAAILAAGFAAATFSYFLAPPRPSNPFGYDPLRNKKFIHDLELYGGKANVLAAQFNDWFIGLWYGKNLTFTIAVITVIVALLVRWIMTTVPAEDVAKDSRRV